MLGPYGVLATLRSNCYQSTLSGVQLSLGLDHWALQSSVIQLGSLIVNAELMDCYENLFAHFLLNQHFVYSWKIKNFLQYFTFLCSCLRCCLSGAAVASMTACLSSCPFGLCNIIQKSTRISLAVCPQSKILGKVTE